MDCIELIKTGIQHQRLNKRTNYFCF